MVETVPQLSAEHTASSLAMRSHVSAELGDLAAIYDANIELISVRPPGNRPQLDDAVARLVSARGELNAQWSQAPADVETALSQLSPVADADLAHGLSELIADAAVVLDELLDCRSVGVRVGLLRKPMCPRFHVDHVPCRMLVTVSGPGTEWIAHSDLDLHRFEDRSTNEPPLSADGKVRVLPTGAWSLLKGGIWSDGYTGVVHRSPPADGGAGRLLASFDPIFQ